MPRTLALLLAAAASVLAGDRLTVPTPQEAVDRMVDVARLQPGEKVYDLGCGDGRIVISAARRVPIRAVGVDIDPAQVAKSRANTERAGVSDRVKIVEGDIYKTDFSDADAVFLYLQPDLLRGLIPQLRRMKPGSRIVTFDFGIDGLSSRLAVVAHAAEVAGEEKVLVALAIFDHAHLFAHPPLADHFAGYTGGLFDIAAGAAGHVAENDVLGHATAHDDNEVI